MKLTLLPSSVGGGRDLQYLSTCLLNDVIALDAGCLGLWGTPNDQARVRHVLLSHTHMDHLASLPIFVENAYEGKADCVTIHASEDVLECCQRNLFNERVWPDFVALSQGDRPFLRLARFDAGQTIELEGLRITAVALNHVVPTVGYVIADDHSAIAFVSDTGPSDEIWRVADAEPNLQAIFVETTFPEELQWLANVSKHLTPAVLVRELAKVSHPVRVIIVHIKARYQEKVIAELEAAHLPRMEIGEVGKRYEF